MGKLAVKRFAYFTSISFSFFICFISIYSYFCGNIDPNINITPSYICILRPFLILINIFLLIYWIIRFRVWWILAIVGIAFNYDFILGNFNISSNNLNINNRHKLSLISYNVHNFDNEVTGYSAKELAQKCHDEEIDILCFQEYSGNFDFTNEMLFDTFSKYYPYNYTPKERSMAIFSKYPITNKHVISFKNTNNGSLWADITINDKTIRIFNVHMQSTYFNRIKSNISKINKSNDNVIISTMYNTTINTVKNNLKFRAKQANYISNVIDTTNTPVILCGDFNDIPETYTYKKLKGSMEDGFINSGNGFGSTYKGLKNLFRIDYIFHSKSLNSSNYKIFDYEMSDHKPVYMEIDL